MECSTCGLPLLVPCAGVFRVVAASFLARPSIYKRLACGTLRAPTADHPGNSPGMAVLEQMWKAADVLLLGGVGRRVGRPFNLPVPVEQWMRQRRNERGCAL